MFCIIPASLGAAYLKKYPDRKVALFFLTTGAANFMWMYHFAENQVLDIVLFTIGACISLSSNNISQSFTWALQTKITPPDQRITLVGINSGVYMLGRGAGAFWGSAITTQSLFAAVGMGAMSACAFTYVLAYQWLKPQD